MDRILALEVAGTDVDALFVRLFRDYHGDIHAYLCRLTGDVQLAEDLAQDTFVKAYRALGRLPASANRRAWLYRIATNTALDHLRRRRLISWLPLFEDDRHPAADTSFQDASLESVAVQRTLARLVPRYRVPLLLFACQGLSTAEIARVLRISPGAVKTRLFRAREKFRRLYAPEEGDG
ncbi:MAG TPA: RNA polymerase sigma factor [Anaerolineae bacterium]|nr:RNA polymerase sigma factor [Anaerolineae bacterium]